MTWLHRSAVLLAASAVLLVLVGALVTSTGSGLSVASWPSTFDVAAANGTVPAGARLQQAHRVVAGLVGLLTLLVAAGIWRFDQRPWMMGLSAAALATVIAQAIYGGIGVLNLLPPYFTVFHTALAQVFLGLAIAMAVFTSPGWLAHAAHAEAEDRSLRRWAVAATAVIYLQILLGAAMRHAYTPDGRPAGFAIPDYPLAFGQLLPFSELGSWATALAFLHRLNALATVVVVGMLALQVFRRHLSDDSLVRPAALLAVVMLAQVALGGLTVLSGGHPAVSTTHAGAVTAAMGAALVLALRSWRPAAGLSAPSPSAGKGTAE